eukprot:141361-Pleurochrysis_carterae.AAC.1
MVLAQLRKRRQRLMQTSTCNPRRRAAGGTAHGARLREGAELGARLRAVTALCARLREVTTLGARLRKGPAQRAGLREGNSARRRAVGDGARRWVVGGWRYTPRQAVKEMTRGAGG